MTGDVTLRAPGKVFLTGEYAVLWGAPACIAAVEPGVNAVRTPLEPGHLELDVPGDHVRGQWRQGRVEWESESAATRFAARALSLALAHRPTAPGFRLRFEPSLRVQRRKLGLGTSAAACTIAALAGIADQEGQDFDPAAVFRTAARAHWEVQGRKGSNGDVAAATFGGVIRYERYPLELPDPPARPALEMIEPGQLKLAMVYSGKSVRTPSMVGALEQQLNAGDRTAFAQASAERTQAFVSALRSHDERAALAALNAAGDLLADLGRRADVGIVTPELAAIQNLGRSASVAAKVSGAGGGDGAVFAAFDRAALRQAIDAAERAGYTTVELPIATGVSLKRATDR